MIKLIKNSPIDQSIVRVKHNLDPTKATGDVIYRDFENNYLELIRLLKEAAGLEHLLMLQYLYAAFSIKDKYKDVRGSIGGEYFVKPVKNTLIGVAIEEMRHLNMVNDFLSTLGASPNLMPHQPDEVSEIYPFKIELVSLSKRSTATYLYVEADACALNPYNEECVHSGDEVRFIKEVLKELGNTRPNHLGSLYGSIIRISRNLRQQLPDFLTNEYIDWNRFENNMVVIKDQGEKDHYNFFKSVFTASHDGFNKVAVWELAYGSENYPSILFDPSQITANEGQEKVIRNENDRKIGWLSNLHYWIILALLDVNYREPSMKPKYKAIGNMTEALVSLGLFLAKKGIGIPFDPPSIKPNFGKNTAFSLHIINLMVEEARDLAIELKQYLPKTFNFKVYRYTLNGLTLDTSQ